MYTKARTKKQAWQKQGWKVASALAQLFVTAAPSGRGTPVVAAAAERWRAKRRNLSPQQMDGESGLDMSWLD